MLIVLLNLSSGSYKPRSMHRDKDDPERMKAWRFATLQVSFVYRVGVIEDAYWLAQNSRQSKKQAGLSMVFTCLQKVYSVLHFKAKYEKVHGEVGAIAAVLRLRFSIQDLGIQALKHSLCFVPSPGVEKFCKIYEEKLRHADENEKARTHKPP